MLIIRDHIKKFALEIGFDLCGVVPVEKKESFIDRLNVWMDNNYHAEMSWIEKNNDLRKDASLYIDDAKSVIVCALSYIRNSHNDNFAKYSFADDYHYVMRDMLTKLNDKIKEYYNINMVSRIIVDSAPLPEKEYAVSAGLGWIGKNSLLVNKNLGSYILLCEMVIDKQFDTYDTKDDFDGCASCRRCIDSCKSGAIISPYVIDSRRCVSYLTIEHKGDFNDIQKNIVSKEKYFFGCDTCMDVCPYNKKAIKNYVDILSSKTELLFKSDRYDKKYSVDMLLNMSNADFKKYFKHSPLIRLGLERLIRNIKNNLNDSL